MTGPRLVPGRDAQVIVDALAAGQVIAVPLDGGYQAAVLADRPDAVADLEAVAGVPRPEETPHFLVGHSSQAAALVAEWSTGARRLTDRCWPGPLAIILAAPDGAGSICLSMGTTRTLRRIIRRCGPLRVSELRQNGEPPLATAAQVMAQCDGDTIALVLDGGTRGGHAPTVVDCRLSPPRLLFEGALPAAYIDAALLMRTRRRTLFG